MVIFCIIIAAKISNIVNYKTKPRIPGFNADMILLYVQIK